MVVHKMAHKIAFTHNNLPKPSMILVCAFLVLRLWLVCLKIKIEDFIKIRIKSHYEKNDKLYDELDKELKKQGLRFIRYADDFSIYTKSKSAARRIGNNTYLFLKQKLKFPVRETTVHETRLVYPEFVEGYCGVRGYPLGKSA